LVAQQTAGLAAILSTQGDLTAYCNVNTDDIMLSPKETGQQGLNREREIGNRETASAVND
jgi:hypothetical protein